VKQEVACRSANGKVILSVESVPFSEIPGQSGLFTRYQSDPLSLRSYYPNVITGYTDTAARIPEVLERHTADRDVLCDALEEMNRKFGATEKTLANIELLRDGDTVAVVSGQQSGLFTGPLYTIFKALSAIRVAECLQAQGHKAVPVFWVATEDHDFEEVSKTFIPGRNGGLAELKNEPKRCYDNLPVGYIKLDESIELTINELFDELPQTEFSIELRRAIEDAWSPHSYFGDAFGKQITQLLGKYGLIILCPLDSRLKSLAAPIYKDAIINSEEIVSALIARSGRLVEDGFNAQVHIGEDYFPLFWQARDGTRNSLKRGENGTFHTKDGSREFTLEELADIAAREPVRFSPSVVLRSVVQDYLLPTLVYFGGAAEIAYFAQSSEVYRLLGRPVTPILHRQSFTMIEPKHARTMKKYDMAFNDLFLGLDELIPRIISKTEGAGTARLIAEAEEKINIELNRLDQELASVDPTLADGLAKRRRKIIYHISAIRNKYNNVQFRRDSDTRRRIESLLGQTLPGGHLQERSLNVVYFLNKYGPYFIDWIYDSIDLDDKGHRLVYI
jgi:bacillithiol synthase